VVTITAATNEGHVDDDYPSTCNGMHQQINNSVQMHVQLKHLTDAQLRALLLYEGLQWPGQHQGASARTMAVAWWHKPSAACLLGIHSIYIRDCALDLQVHESTGLAPALLPCNIPGVPRSAYAAAPAVAPSSASSGSGV
jgi:hypothetical protein